MELLSGSKVLSELDRGLAELRADLGTMDESIRQSTRSVEELGVRKLGLYRELAERRLAQLERGDLVRELDGVSREIHDLLERRLEGHRALLGEISEHEAEQERLEEERERQRLEVEAAEAALDEREAEVQSRLAEDEAYDRQLQQARAADAVADRAESKTEDAVADQTAKGAPYESDKLFMYLWHAKESGKLIEELLVLFVAFLFFKQLLSQQASNYASPCMEWTPSGKSESTGLCFPT